jgi:hypothetical protein
MPQPAGFQLRLGWSGWLAIVIVVGLVLVLAAVLAVILIAVFIVLLPVALVAAVVYYFFPGLRNRQPYTWREPDIIEGEYRVIDPRPIDRERLPKDEP